MVGWTRKKSAVAGGLVSLVGLVVFAGAGAAFGGGGDGAGAGGGGSSMQSPITLVFPGQMLSNTDRSSYPITVPYPPTEGSGQYVVPNGSRLVIESAYAETSEEAIPPATGLRSSVTASVSTFYDLGPNCAFPGYQRNYGLAPTDTGTQHDQGRRSVERAYALAGPIFVEAGRTVVAGAWGPGGNSQVIVKVVLHGHLEPSATRIKPPTCG